MISVVTGGSGFVGSHLVDLLLSKGHKVKCIVRKTSSLRWLKNKPVEIIDAGLFDVEKLKEIVKGVDYLFHVAGVVKAKTYDDYYNGNVQTTKNLLDAVLEVNSKIKRVVIVGSLTASGPAALDKPNTEETAPNPITRYGKSKLQQEQAALEYKDKLPITIVRAPAIYGERDTEIFLVFKTYKQGLMSLIGFNKKSVSIIHVLDFVRGLYLASQSDKAKGETYFVSSEGYYDWLQISAAIRKAMGKKAFTLRIPHTIVYTVAAVAQFFSMFSSKAATFNLEKARDFVQEAWTCDITKAKKDLGYNQEISLEAGMKRTVDWYKAEKWL